jgi:hypothetical protein
MKKLGFLGFILLLALAFSGAAYANWSQQLAVGGNVRTGSFDVQFQNVLFVKDSNGIGDGSISSISADSFTLNVDRLYPGCEESVSFDLVNSGSIPAKIGVLKISFQPVGGNIQEYSLPVLLDLSSPVNNKSDIRVSLTGVSHGDLIEPNTSKTGCNLTIHTLISELDTNDSDPGVSGTFQFTIIAVQN